MKILSDIRCGIGEAPVWNNKEQKLYFTNGMKNQICAYDFKSEKSIIRDLPFGVAAIAFDLKNRLIVSHIGGVHILNDNDSLTPIYDNSKYQIKHANDMKVGPDGAIYVGTQSEFRKGISNKVDGKLYRISPSGEVEVLLDNLSLSNGMEWSIDERYFYHTDSDTHIIKEYSFDKKTGKINYTNREIGVTGVDGFTIGSDNNLYVGCWGQGHVAVVNANTMRLSSMIEMPCITPVSCSFCGKDMDVLATTTASCYLDVEKDVNAGYTLLLKMQVKGRVPYLFGAQKAL